MGDFGTALSASNGSTKEREILVTKRVRKDSRTKRRESGKDAQEIQYVDHPSFRSRSAARTLWGKDRERIQVPSFRLLDAVDPEHGHSRPARASLTREQEQRLFLMYNYAKYRLNRLQSQRPTRKRKVEMASWRKRAMIAREKIIHANLPLAPAMASRKRVEGADFSDKVAEGYMAILRSVEHFDVSKGFKFSTYACRAILSALYRLGSKAQTYRKHVPVYFDPALEKDDATEQRNEYQRNDAIDSVRRLVRTNGAALSEVEAEVIEQRFPLADDAKPTPRWVLGRELGVSTDRVRQIEMNSLRKLGHALDEVMST